MYTYGNTNTFQKMPIEEIKNEPGESPNHNPSNQYQLQPVHGLLNSKSTSPGPDRSPATLTPSPVVGGSISPLDPGNVTPTPPAYTTLNGPVGNPFGNFGTFGNSGATTQQQSQGVQMFDSNLPGPSNGWVQPVPMHTQNGPNHQQSFNLGNFGSLPLTSDPILSMGATSIGAPSNNQPNVGAPSMVSDFNFMNLDFGSLEPVLNSSELRSVLGNLSNSDLNRLDQVAGQAINMQMSGSYQQLSASNQQQALRALLATQQQQQQQQQQHQQPGQTQALPDRNDNDEDLTDSFTKLSTNDLD
ncbi:forkhead box protein O-like [Anopheles nili]|uniref:forkhead box protein O-like n=1 Tax=Anopheles nili TaxID=185578 RepID=UPI00237B2F2F|nr:forkhead box protein O-like [Anopheles nili]